MLLKFGLLFLLMLFNILDILVSDDSLYMSAENFFKDEKNNFIRANGNVEIKKGSIFIHADSLIYNIEKKEILLEGNVRILTETGEVVFAKKAKLNEKLQDGVITNLGVLLSDGSRLASREALTSKNNKKTVYKKTVFTKCKSCKDDRSVLWQIKSKKASHLKDKKIIVYEGVTLETFDIPIAYIPFFYHPDPTVKNKTGFLAPKFTSSNVFGYIYEQPLYLKLKKNADITIKPRFTSKEGVVLANNYRKNFKTGELTFKSSITRGNKIRENEPTKKEIRGHIDFAYADRIKNDWLLGANIKKSSDKSYLARYRMSEGESILTQNIFLEKGNASNKILFEGYKFQTLSDDFSSTNLPFIRPQIIYTWDNLNNINRKRINNAKIVFRSITNKKNQNSNSLHWINSSEKDYLYNGLLIKNSYKLNLDFYNTKNINANDSDASRVLPELGVELKYPFISTKNKDAIIEPILQIFSSGKNNDNSRIKNIDSRTIELNSSNLFEGNKYSGFDRIEDGLRMNYGFTYIINKKNNDSFYSSFGRTFHLNEQEYFNYTNGLGRNNSDFVGNIEFKKNNSLNFYYDFRVSDELELNKNRFKTGFDIGQTRVGIQYSQIRNFSSSRNANTEQLNYSTSTKLFKNWTLNFSQYRDLAGAEYGSPLRTTFGIEFKNICTLISVNLTKDKSNDIDVPASANLAFEIKLF